MTKPKRQPIAETPLPDAPGEYERKAIQIATTRMTARRRRVSVTLSGDANKLRVENPHNDLAAFSMRLLDTFGTTSNPFVDQMMGQLVKGVREHGESHGSEQALNAALAMIDGVQPENEVEAALAVQMVTTHGLAMAMLTRTKHADMLPQFEAYGALAVKLLRTFTLQAEALAKLRRGGGQTVRVEHVHVHAGGQAIVGNVAPGGGAILKSEDQPHAKQDTRTAALTNADAPFDPLRSAHPKSDRVPVASDA